MMVVRAHPGFSSSATHFNSLSSCLRSEAKLVTRMALELEQFPQETGHTVRAIRVRPKSGGGAEGIDAWGE